MKWWGWGDEDFRFPMEEKPDLWPWIQSILGAPADERDPPLPLERIVLPPARVHDAFASAFAELAAQGRFLSGAHDRLLHAFGKSFPDLYRVRHGEIPRAPDAVLLPRNHEEVERIVEEASRNDVVVIPFGGGTNIVGGVNPEPGDDRMVVSLDLKLMDRLLEIDEASLTATIEAGALGPRIEEQLAARGYALGHHPDSFEHSTLGGWLATRSAGMQSDAYGKIEDMVVALKMVTPGGTLVTRPRPRASTGPDLNQLAVGSEGILGVITEASMRVHPRPEVAPVHGFFFRGFEAGLEAMRACVQSGPRPDLFRLSDERETELALHMRPRSRGFESLVSAVVRRVLRSRGFVRPVLMLVGFEGRREEVARRRRAVFRMLRARGGCHLGRGVGRSWSREKYHLPYLRDELLDRCCIVDVAETSVPWSRALDLHRSVSKAMHEAFAAVKRPGYLGCHLSHTYETGVCLYFTYGCRQPETDVLAFYDALKGRITEAILAAGGALSHHHAIGREHRPWVKKELDPTALCALRSVKQALDPGRIMNPGKLLPD